MAGRQLGEAPRLPPPGLPVPEHSQVSALPVPSSPGDLCWAGICVPFQKEGVGQGWNVHIWGAGAGEGS